MAKKGKGKKWDRGNCGEKVFEKTAADYLLEQMNQKEQESSEEEEESEDSKSQENQENPEKGENENGENIDSEGNQDGKLPLLKKKSVQWREPVEQDVFYIESEKAKSKKEKRSKKIMKNEVKRLKKETIRLEKEAKELEIQKKKENKLDEQVGDNLDQLLDSFNENKKTEKNEEENKIEENPKKSDPKPQEETLAQKPGMEDMNEDKEDEIIKVDGQTIIKKMVETHVDKSQFKQGQSVIVFTVDNEEVLVDKSDLIRLKKIRKEREQYKVDKELEEEKKKKLKEEKDETLAKLKAKLMEKNNRKQKKKGKKKR